MQNYFVSQENEISSQNEQNSTVKPYYTASNMEYPSFILESDVIEKYKINLLKGLIDSSKPEDGYVFSVYLKVAGKSIKIGYIKNTNLKDIISSGVFMNFKKSAWLNNNYEVVGEKMYALCGV